MPLLDIQTANNQIGNIRIGAKKVSAKSGKEYPAALDTFRFTSHVKSAIDECARVFGGEVVPWDGHPGQWEVITERKEIRALAHGRHSLSQWYEQWVSGGCTHRCDGVTCTRRDADGTEYQQDCTCDPELRGKVEGRRILGCKPCSRLSVMLTEINSTGRWLFTSGGKIFATEIAGYFETCQALNLPDFLFVVLTLEEEEIKKPGQKPEKFVVVRCNLDPNPPNFLGRIVSLVQSSQYVLPSSNPGAPAIGAGQAPAFGAGVPTDQKAAAAQYLRDIGLTEDQKRRLAATVKAAGKTLTHTVLAAKAANLRTFAEMSRFAQREEASGDDESPFPPSEPAPTPTSNPAPVAPSAIIEAEFVADAETPNAYLKGIGIESESDFFDLIAKLDEVGLPFEKTIHDAETGGISTVAGLYDYIEHLTHRQEGLF